MHSCERKRALIPAVLKYGSLVVEVVSDSFRPIIGVMAGSGMLKALLSLMLTFGWLADDSGSYFALSAAANAVFFFLPVLLGISAAKRLGSDGYLGAAVGASLLEPNFTSLIGTADLSFMGFPLVAMNYSCTVFPIFIAVTVLAVLERYLKRICPQNIQLFLVPMSCLLIIVPLTILGFWTGRGFPWRSYRLCYWLYKLTKCNFDWCGDRWKHDVFGSRWPALGNYSGRYC